MTHRESNDFHGDWCLANNSDADDDGLEIPALSGEPDHHHGQMLMMIFVLLEIFTNKSRDIRPVHEGLNEAPKVSGRHIFLSLQCKKNQI